MSGKDPCRRRSFISLSFAVPQYIRDPVYVITDELGVTMSCSCNCPAVLLSPLQFPRSAQCAVL